jgi:hypothetical protein
MMVPLTAALIGTISRSLIKGVITGKPKGRAETLRGGSGGYLMASVLIASLAQTAVKQPSTARSAPATKLLSSEARNSAAARDLFGPAEAVERG